MIHTADGASNAREDVDGGRPRGSTLDVGRPSSKPRHDYYTLHVQKEAVEFAKDLVVARETAILTSAEQEGRGPIGSGDQSLRRAYGASYAEFMPWFERGVPWSPVQRPCRHGQEVQ